MTLSLYGFNASNYYNKSKLALLEAGADFTEHQVFPSAIDRSSSPLGKARVGAAFSSLEYALGREFEGSLELRRHPKADRYALGFHLGSFSRARCAV